MTTKYQFNDEALSKGPFTIEKLLGEYCVFEPPPPNAGKYGRLMAKFYLEADARFFVAMRNVGAMELFLEVADRVGELDKETGYVLTTDCDPDGDTALDCLMSSGVVHQVQEGE